ncbi:MAG TPA: efflux RND transporter periplasmic adaptor subunit, partial [Anaerolineae bacterium]
MGVTMPHPNPKRVLPIVIIVVLALIGYWVYSNSTASNETNTASGFIEGEEIAVASEVGGRIEAITVEEGDRVTAGQELVRLDRATANAQIAQAQAARDTANAQLTQRKNQPRASDVAAARAAQSAAQQMYDKVRAGPTADQLALLKTQMDNAKAMIDQAQAAYDRIGGASNPMIAMLPQSVALQQATNNYAATLAAFNDARSHPTAAELAAAQSQIDQAQAALDRLTPTTDAIAVAAASVKQADAALAVLQTQLAKMTLTSPVNGFVTRRAAHAGEIAAPNATLLSVANLDSVKLTIYVPETRIGAIKPGDEFDVKVDSFPDKTFKGKVIFINTQAEFTPRNV